MSQKILTVALRFVLRNGRLNLCAASGSKRKYQAVYGLTNPNYSKWDAKSQRFIGTDAITKANNTFLKAFIMPFQRLLTTEPDISTPEQLFERNDRLNRLTEEAAETVRISTLTLEGFVAEEIEKMRTKPSRHPSANYAPYYTLLSKLKQEGHIGLTPLSNLSRETQSEFAKWVLTEGKGKNYRSLNTMLQAMINRAYRAGASTYQASFPWREYQPTINTGVDKAHKLIVAGADGTVKTLTKAQYQQFLDMDVSTLEWRRSHLTYYNELYRDYLILLYELKSRPMDIIKLHWDNIAWDGEYGRFICTYIPAKKKNYDVLKPNSESMVYQLLSDKATEILLKYKGKSKGGYVLPFAMNNETWNLSDPLVYQRYYETANRTEGRINRFLKKVGEKLGVPFDLTIYAFRRSAITHEIMKGEMSKDLIAELAGTSVEMINKHYQNKHDSLARQSEALRNQRLAAQQQMRI